MNYGPRVIQDGLILYLDAKNPKSYPGTGSIWYDMSSANNNFTLANNPVWSGSSFSFNKAAESSADIGSSSLDIPANADLNVASGVDRTIEIVFKIDDVNSIGGAGMGLFADQFNSSGALGINPNDTIFWQWDDSSITDWEDPSGPLLEDEKVHFTVVLESSNVAYYKNGVMTQNFQVIHDDNWAYTVDLDEFAIARQTRDFSGNFRRGDITVSVVRVYNKVLSNTEILQNFNATRSRFGL